VLVSRIVATAAAAAIAALSVPTAAAAQTPAVHHFATAGPSATVQLAEGLATVDGGATPAIFICALCWPTI
jgi:hypothetical protein